MVTSLNRCVFACRWTRRPTAALPPAAGLHPPWGPCRVPKKKKKKKSTSSSTPTHIHGGEPARACRREWETDPNHNHCRLASPEDDRPASRGWALDHKGARVGGRQPRPRAPNVRPFRRRPVARVHVIAHFAELGLGTGGFAVVLVVVQPSKRWVRQLVKRGLLSHLGRVAKDCGERHLSRT